jgi:CubicO group peptidase (beta-lactamase class C family)
MRSAVLFVTVLAASLAGLAPVTPGDDLVGLWGTEDIVGPPVRGELTVIGGPGRWTARVGGFEVQSRGVGDTVRFTLPGGQGELRAHLVAGGRAIRGFWVQPAGLLTSVPYASPVTLTRVRDRVWRGNLVPVDDRWSLYLLVQREPDGSLQGAFRNPETNWRGGASWFHVIRDRDTLRFLDPDSGRQRLAVGYDSAQRRIRMDFGRPVILTPRTRDQAVGFYPRTPAGAAYTYRIPVAQGDGWSVAPASEAGLDAAPLSALVQRIATTDPVSAGAPLIHSVLVARHRTLVLEEYFYGFDDARPHDLRSASKTFTSVMVGAAIDHGMLRDVDTPVYAAFPGARTLAATDPRKASITLAHLLTHSSGLACDDANDDSPGNEDRMQTQATDWYQYILALPVVHDPGTTYAYCSGGMNLAGGVLAHAAGMWLPDFFDRYVAAPLQIQHYAINLMPSGEAYGGGGVQMRPRDLLKFGQAYLDGGVWNGRRLVSRAWVERSTAHQIDSQNGGSDGYGWHRSTLTVDGRAYREYEANGNGGQFLIVVPDLDLVVVFTAGNYQQYQIWRKFRDEMVGQYVIAAVRGR